jgi:hypothetical protein
MQTQNTILNPAVVLGKGCLKGAKGKKSKNSTGQLAISANWPFRRIGHFGELAISVLQTPRSRGAVYRLAISEV